MGASSQSRISYFKDSSIKGIELPARFTFPFYYQPHPLTEIAAAELQQYLESQTGLDHNFGLSTDKDGMIIGKMFGVLVVQDAEGKPGYLSGFSGKLAGSNDHPEFVPPVFDMLIENSFFLKEQEIIQSINIRIGQMESDESYCQLQQSYRTLSAESIEEVDAFKLQLRSNKNKRKQFREKQKSSLSREEYTIVEAGLIKQSLHDKHQLKLLANKWERILADIQTRLEQYETAIETLKSERKDRSAALQQQLFSQYLFLNKDGKTKSIQEIFSATALGKPPAGAGECATPKLLQFAFMNGYKPLAMAEFWWGASPKSEIRKHKHFYPACTGKCKPILAHMLEGMAVEESPFLRSSDESGKLEIVYEDESFIVVNKPPGLRSVPGVDIHDSVYTRLKHLLANKEPLIIHRLDMDTSGLLVVAKTREAHKHIQKQFLQRTIKKRYRALLSKAIDQAEGEINLPLAPDLLNRPRQLVCFDAGKKSITRWKVVEKTETATKVDFWPLTGRTHQLRMHAAHELGLNAPIVGDDLYGTASERMCLHAAQIEFTHPETKERVCFEVEERF
ncbi:RluA family pseudouridine synthase [Filimonas effusa]|uniref:RluA family pseudouridine synthase n=1 Tax=Filimonas effusa TaxID=2508721 RepID=A0A4Q1D1Z7_9BACT|nr:RluA family pseudouridine synthase [Filimonas effusa]RXK81320.1 RluA family pseudouridine synthase [Filimonas effusa]